MTITYHRHFIKGYHKLTDKLRKATDESISLFQSDQYQITLNNHKLKGKWRGYRSIDITGDYRAIFRHTSADDVLFIIVGTHHQLYGS